MKQAKLMALESLVVVLLVAAAASAVPVSDGLYFLDNHPDGVQIPPPYGLRLDGLDGVRSHVFTFDFNYVDPTTGQTADMFLNLDKTAGTIHLFGDLYGGLNDPANANVYAPTSSGKVGWWEVDFTYSANVALIGSDGFGLTDVIADSDGLNFASTANRGTIDRQFVSSTMAPSFAFVDKDGDDGYSFRFGDDDQFPGHRGFPGISGWGWVTHDGFLGPNGQPSHVIASDWLFTARIPLPSTGLLLALGAGLIGWARKRML